MRYIPRIPPITVAGNLEFTQAAFVEHMLDDKRFTASGAGLRSSIRIDKALREEGLFVVEEADWKTLASVVEEPSHGYPALVERTAEGATVRTIPIGRKLMAFVEAIVQATETKPETPVTPPKTEE